MNGIPSACRSSSPRCRSDVPRIPAAGSNVASSSPAGDTSVCMVLGCNERLAVTTERPTRDRRDVLMTSSTMTETTGRPAASAIQSTPIDKYGMLADCNSAAHVSLAGSVDWLCLPRYDSPAIFARLLGPDAGHWQIRPTAPYRAERRYVPGTLVVETTFTTAA